MTRFLLCMMLAPVLTAPMAAQGAKSGSNWQHVQALPAGTELVVKATSQNKHCFFKAADADTLTCVDKRNIVFRRAEIRSIHLRRRGRSALAGAGIGVAIGATAGAVAWKPSWWPVTRGGAGSVVGIAFGGVGAIAGNFTDFTGSTVYKAE